jgi:hypothetical protein
MTAKNDSNHDSKKCGRATNNDMNDVTNVQRNGHKVHTDNSVIFQCVTPHVPTGNSVESVCVAART